MLTMQLCMHFGGGGRSARVAGRPVKAVVSGIVGASGGAGCGVATGESECLPDQAVIFVRGDEGYPASLLLST